MTPKELPFFSKLLELAKMKPKPKEDGPHYADLYVRAIAACIDIILLFTILAKPFNRVTEDLYLHADKPLLEKAQEATSTSERLLLLWQSHLPQFWLVNMGFQLAVIGAIIVLLQCLWHTTPGKWIMMIRILDAKTEQPPAKWRYVLRYVAYIPSAAFAMLGIFWIGFNKRRRGWHDYIAGTVVMHRHPRGWVWQQVKHGVRWAWVRLRQASAK